ncbi:hypothetical protein McanMca71_002584 [Microsporum canis]
MSHVWDDVAHADLGQGMEIWRFLHRRNACSVLLKGHDDRNDLGILRTFRRVTLLDGKATYTRTGYASQYPSCLSPPALTFSKPPLPPKPGIDGKSNTGSWAARKPTERFYAIGYGVAAGYGVIGDGLCMERVKKTRRRKLFKPTSPYRQCIHRFPPTRKPRASSAPFIRV